ERQRQDHCRQRQYNPHESSIAMRGARPRRRRTFTLGCASAALVALTAFVAAPDDVEVTFKEWQTPSTPPYPHDPEVAPDGSVWYTAQRASALGRLDPATGAFKEYPLPPSNSGTHGLVADAAGHIWYTGNAVGLIGRLDPKTGRVTEYKMPDGRARDPHTPIFDARGILWFTVQGGNFVGSLDPA